MHNLPRLTAMSQVRARTLRLAESERGFFVFGVAAYVISILALGLMT